MRTLGAMLCIRNGIRLDYCFQHAIESLLPICSQIVVSDCESDDGTSQFLADWQKEEPKLTLTTYKWTDPRGDITWYPTWVNDARSHLTTSHAIYLDADEILHEDSYDRVLQACRDEESLTVYRYNFWRDPQTLIPVGHCLGHECIRVGPANYFFPSDYFDPRAEAIIKATKRCHDIHVMHYGFLRERNAFFRKARQVQSIWLNDYDPRLAKAETDSTENWMCIPDVVSWAHLVTPFTGTHPKIILPWLRERGYKV